MKLKSILSALFVLIWLSIMVYCDEENPVIINLPNNEFAVKKAELAEQEFMTKVTKELGKVSDEVRHFLERILRVAKTIFKDWILKDDDGSESTDSTDE